MANEFIIKNGLISQGNITVSGSITATGGVIVSGSIASASYASNAELLDGLDSTVFTLTGSFIAQTASFTAFTSSINSFSASILAQTASLNSFSASILTFTGSAATRLGALEAATSSLYSYTSSLNAKTSSFATTGSNTFIGTETISGSLVISGSGTPFTLNTDTLEITGSLLVTGSATFTGSVNFSSGLTGSLLGTSSYASNANLLDGLDSTVFTSTASFAAQTASFTAFTASILAQTASLNSFSASVLTFTGSAATRLGALEAATSSLYSYTSSLNNKTSSFATTGSNIFIGTQTITGSVLQSGSFTSTGTLTAQTLVVQTITSSVVYSSGSNIFGNAIGNTQIFTGSLSVTGSTASFAGSVGIGTTSPGAKLEVILPANTLSHIFRSTVPENLLSIQTFPTTNRMQLLVGDYNGTATPNIAAISDTNTGIQWAGSDIIRFVNNGSENVTINATGNVGIGTTTPSTLFYVNGYTPSNWITTLNNTGISGHQLYFGYNDGTTTQYGLYIAGGPGSGSANFDFAVGNKFRVYADGNVGIGTTAPLAKLAVGNGSLSDANLPIQISSAGSGTERWIGINKSGSYGLLVGYYESTSLAGSGSYIRQVTTDPLFFAVNNTTTAMTILSNGNIGIGTTAPSSLLEVYNGDIKINNTYKFGWRYSSGDTNMYNYIYSSYDDTTVGITYRSGGWTSSTTITSHNFQTSISATWVSRLVILQNGNVGIGTTAPQKLLHILAPTGAHAYQRIEGGSGGYGGFLELMANTEGSGADSAGRLDFYMTSTNRIATISAQRISAGANYGTLTFSTADNSTTPTERMRITSGGNVLIGTTSQGYIGSELMTLSKDSGTTKWSVGPYTGQATQFYIAAGSGVGVYLPNASATSWSSNSDERLKTELKPIENAAEKVTSLRAVTGRYKTDAEGYSRAFLIAQDVQAVLPEAVTSTRLAGSEDKTEYLSLSYTDVIPLLVGAIQELKAELDQAKVEIEILKNK